MIVGTFERWPFAGLLPDHGIAVASETVLLAPGTFDPVFSSRVASFLDRNTELGEKAKKVKRCQIAVNASHPLSLSLSSPHRPLIGLSVTVT
jgi:hypothetical protein